MAPKWRKVSLFLDYSGSILKMRKRRKWSGGLRPEADQSWLSLCRCVNTSCTFSDLSSPNGPWSQQPANLSHITAPVSFEETCALQRTGGFTSASVLDKCRKIYCTLLHCFSSSQINPKLYWLPFPQCSEFLDLHRPQLMWKVRFWQQSGRKT